MSLFWKSISYAFITLILGIVLREFGFRGNKLIFIIGIVALTGTAILSFEKISSSLPFIGDGESKEYVTDIMKIIGVGYTGGICSDMCSEFGENGLSSAILSVCKIEMVLIVLPYAVRIIEEGSKII